ncbi:MAG: hypothetical protein ACLSGI_06165 [Butyricicoccaceae bacterium]
MQQCISAAAWRKSAHEQAGAYRRCAYQLISRYLVVDGRECVLSWATGSATAFG